MFVVVVVVVVIFFFIGFIIASKPKTPERLGVGSDRQGLSTLPLSCGQPNIPF